MRSMLGTALAIGLLLVLGYVMLPEYRAGLVAVAPYLLILACPLAMMFMMRDMHGDRSRDKDGDRHRVDH